MLFIVCLLAWTFDAPSDATTWDVIPAGSPSPFLNRDGQVETIVEASGVELLGDGSHLLIAHDKAPTLRVYQQSSGQPVGSGLTCGEFPEGLPVGPKWEGLARDSDGAYYVIGSHSGKDDSERTQRAYLLRFQVVGTGTAQQPWTIKPGSVRRWHLAENLHEQLKNEKLTPEQTDRRKIEGLAVRETWNTAGQIQSRHLAIGLREPADLVRVFEVDITTPPAPEAQLKLQPAFSFAAGKSPDGQEDLQLTSLEHRNSGAHSGYFVVTASEDASNVFHGNRLWFISDQQLTPPGPNNQFPKPVQPELVWTFEPTQKAEGFTLLPGGSDHEFAAIIVFDNDAHKTQTPSRFQRLTLRRHTPSR